MEQERGRVKDAKRRLTQRLDRLTARAKDCIREGREPEQYITAMTGMLPAMMEKERDRVSPIMVEPLKVWLEETVKDRGDELRRYAKGGWR